MAPDRLMEPGSGERQQPTQEQLDVVHHPIGQHARVVAVAGSGKTTTMIHRIEYLVRERQVNPKRILVLMYNAEARKDFKRKLQESQIPAPLQPSGVNTFHSFAYRWLNHSVKQGLIPQFQLWTDDYEYKHQLTINEAIREVCRRERVDREEIDADEVAQAISLWKGSLIPPKRAGFRGHPLIPAIYGEYEQRRHQAGGLTFDDMVPAAVSLLETAAQLGSHWSAEAEFVIVDEYQDVNYSQQRLLELVADRRADVMVVGDDDQTIYEWRGARPNYIIRQFQQVFDNKPFATYKLSHSFRFGPVLAQSAQNVISFNSNRLFKPLVAHDAASPSELVVITDHANQAADVDKELTDHIEILLNEDGVEPTDIVVLARMFVQLSGLETHLLARKIPYHVKGARPFFERREVQSLLDYVRVACELTEPMSLPRLERLSHVWNMPSRMLNRATLDQAGRQAIGHSSVTEVLWHLSSPDRSPFNPYQRERVDALHMVLIRIAEFIAHDAMNAGNLLEWTAQSVNYGAHFDHYYGQGETAADRKLAVASFLDYATSTGLRPLAFLHHVANQDPTQGQPHEQQLMLTTIFKAKGLEFDYVIMPRCEEGYLPCLHGQHVAIFDTQGKVKAPEPSASIENERRLFYVGITRARKAAILGASARPTQGYLRKDAVPSRFLEEIQLPSVLDVLSPMQRLVDGHPGAEHQVVAGVRRWARLPWVRQSLLENYAGTLTNRGLAADITALLGQTSEAPFFYSRAYEGAPQDSGDGVRAKKEQRERNQPTIVPPTALTPSGFAAQEKAAASNHADSQRTSWFGFLRRNG
ncbi:MAG: ATP-dependent helicase [Chloroflexota bacterium]|nr:ATP-dependent helicase [Chloroflexota bacterium]